MVDVAKAEEQLRGASDLVAELQQRLVEAQPQEYRRSAAPPHVPPSRLPRDNFQEDSACEEYQHPNTITSGTPRNDVSKHLASTWEAESEGLSLPAGNLGLGTRERGNAGSQLGGCEWQGRQRGVGVVRGAFEVGSDGELQTQALQWCDGSAGRTEGYFAVAAANETAPSPRSGPFLPLTIEVRTRYRGKPTDERHVFQFNTYTKNMGHRDRETLRYPNDALSARRGRVGHQQPENTFVKGRAPFFLNASASCT